MNQPKEVFVHWKNGYGFGKWEVVCANTKEVLDSNFSSKMDAVRWAEKSMGYKVIK